MKSKVVFEFEIDASLREKVQEIRAFINSEKIPMCTISSKDKKDKIEIKIAISGDGLRKIQYISLPITKYLSLMELGMHLILKGKIKNYTIVKIEEELFLDSDVKTLSYKQIFYARVEK
jgi:hypothetical protein